ncbi:WEB family [Sesbania bispinosa]|nr:WEB family [Sesbania bispinosa]
MKEEEAIEMLTKLPNKLQAAAQQADQAKSLAQAANAYLLQPQYEAKQARTTPITLESRLQAPQKEI